MLIPASARRLVRACGIALCFRPSAAITAQTLAKLSSGWTFELTPYLWGTGTKDDIQGGGLPRPSVDFAFSDAAALAVD